MRRSGKSSTGTWGAPRATAGPCSLIIPWNGSRALVAGCAGPQVRHLTAKGNESCYPGDRYVDEIGVDVYDWTQKNSAGTQIYPGNAAGTTTGQQQEVLDITLTKRDSLRDWYSVALHHGKPLSFPEWGLVLWKTGSSYLGGGDNAVFIRAMADFISGCSLFGWHAMWEDP
jgi:hypothetical protein